MNLKFIVSIILLFLFQSSFASEVFTCTVNGKTVFQGKPCAGSKELANKVKDSQSQIKGRQAALDRERAEQAAKKDPKVGMTKSEAEKSTWGYPDKINTTTTVNNEFEQWVYRTPYTGSKYLHFTNGRITSITN